LVFGVSDSRIGHLEEALVEEKPKLDREAQL